jgi:hypothetical protein
MPRTPGSPSLNASARANTNANDRLQTIAAVAASCASSALPLERKDIGLARPQELPHYSARFDTAYKLAPTASVEWLTISDRK